MEQRGTLRGRLLAAESGEPLAGAQFFLENAAVLTTDAAGRFEIGGLPRGNLEAFVAATGRVRSRVLFDTTARTDTQLDIKVPRSGKIVGRVTDSDGKPIAGAYVGRSTSGMPFATTALYVSCDDDGRFECQDATLPDSTTWLTASAPGYVAEERRGISADPDGKPLELNFRLLRTHPKATGQKQRVVSGVVRAPNGTALADVLVRWGHLPLVGAITARTDRQGRFRITVPDEKEYLAVLPREFAPEFVEIEAGGDQTADVRLRPASFARGRVVDPDGAPVSGVWVFAIAASPIVNSGDGVALWDACAHTDATGRFELKGIPERASIDFVKPGMGEARNQRLNRNGEENTVVLAHGGVIVGRVIDRRGKPIRDFRVLIGFPRNPRKEDRSEGYFAGYSGVHFTSDDGTFVLSGVGPGSVYRVTALAGGHGEAVLDRVQAVPANHRSKTPPTTLRAGAPLPLRVRAVTSDGKPIAGARVALVNGDPELDQRFSWHYDDGGWNNVVRGRTAADGAANFPALGFSGATVIVRAPGYGRQRVPWRQEEKDLKVVMPAAAVVTGEVRDLGGAPLKRFYVSATSDGDRISVAIKPDDRGRFRIDELPPGSWTITVRAADGSMLHEETIALEAGKTTERVISTTASGE
jgi:hypothetical protein